MFSLAGTPVAPVAASPVAAMFRGSERVRRSEGGALRGPAVPPPFGGEHGGGWSALGATPIPGLAHAVSLCLRSASGSLARRDVTRLTRCDVTRPVNECLTGHGSVLRSRSVSRIGS